jgi:hypothetical protein
MSDSHALHPRWLPLLKIEISSNGQNCFILSQNVPKFELYKHNKSRNICLKAHHYALTVQIWADSGLK